MNRTTKNVKDADFEFNYDNGTVRIKNKKTDMIFKGESAEYMAKLQADALADFHSYTGRHLVYKIGENHFEIMFDECLIRDGVDEDHIYSASSHSNSGTYDWSEAKVRYL